MLQEVCGVERQFQEHEEGGLMHSIRNLVNLVNRRSMSASKKDSGSLFFFFLCSTLAVGVASTRTYGVGDGSEGHSVQSLP